jgi:hypothetical protein
MPEYFYQSQPLSSYSLWELGQFLKTFIDADKRREDAANHERLKKRNIKLPPPNPEYLKLKSAIEAEIKFRQEAKSNV